jgi:hypothetical protein
MTNVGATEQDQAAGFATPPILSLISAGSTDQDESDIPKEFCLAGQKTSVNQSRSYVQDEGEALAGLLLHQDIMPGYTPYQSGMQLEYVSEHAPSTIVYVGGMTIPLSSYQTTFSKYLWIESSGLRQSMSNPNTQACIYGLYINRRAGRYLGDVSKYIQPRNLPEDILKFQSGLQPNTLSC